MKSLLNNNLKLEIICLKGFMLTLLTKKIRNKFCIDQQLENLFELVYRLRNITVIKGLSENKPYITLQNKKLEFPLNQLVFALNQQASDVWGNIQFYDKMMSLYHPTTPLKVICRQSFYLKVSGDLYHVLNNQPIIKLSQSQQFTPTYCSPILESVCRQSIRQLPTQQKYPVCGAMIHNLLIANMLKYGMVFKMEKIRLKQLHKVVQRQLDIFQKQISQLLTKIQLRGHRKLKYFTNMMLMQYAIVHYFIYFHLSWDIMEPITCIIGNCDLVIAYYFFIMKGKDWSLESIHKNYMEEKKWTFLEKNDIDVKKYRQLLEIKQHLQFRLALLSKSPYRLIQQLEKPIKLLDTR